VGERLSLETVDSTITFPSLVRDSLLLAISGAEFRPADLPALDPDEQLVLARRLLREGVLVPGD
jgi:hypothetical protein